jgi:hypothetical protein
LSKSGATTPELLITALSGRDLGVPFIILAQEAKPLSLHSNPGV